MFSSVGDLVTHSVISQCTDFSDLLLILIFRVGVEETTTKTNKKKTKTKIKLRYLNHDIEG